MMIDAVNLHLSVDCHKLAEIRDAASQMSKSGVLRAELPPLVEAELIPTVFITGGAVEIDGALVRLLGWSEFPMAGEITNERRLALRLVMPLDTAIKLRDMFNKQIGDMRTRGH